jgi:hypothetical protein
MGLEERSAIDFNQIPFIQAVMEKCASHPTEGTGDSGALVPGRFYFNTTDNHTYLYTATGWVALSPVTGPTGPAGSSQQLSIGLLRGKSWMTLADFISRMETP